MSSDHVVYYTGIPKQARAYFSSGDAEVRKDEDTILFCKDPLDAMLLSIHILLKDIGVCPHVPQRYTVVRWFIRKQFIIEVVMDKSTGCFMDIDDYSRGLRLGLRSPCHAVT